MLPYFCGRMNIQEIIEEYSKDEMKKLKEICIPLIRKFGGIYQSDYDDFFSIANYTLWKVSISFKEEENDSFDGFLRQCIYNKFKTEITKRNREKIIPHSMIISLNERFQDSDVEFGDLIASDFNIENEIWELSVSENIICFLENLSIEQKEICRLIIKGYGVNEIKKILNMSNSKYYRHIKKISKCNKRIV